MPQISMIALQQIAKAGCTISIDAVDHTPAEIQFLVNEVVKSNAHLVIRNASNLVATALVNFANAGKEHLTIES